MLGRGLLTSRTLLLAVVGVLLPLTLVNAVGAGTPGLVGVMNSGNLLSCGEDNQGQGLTLCASTGVGISQLTAEIDPVSDYYLVYFTVGRGNSTLRTYTTEVFVSAEIPRPARLDGGPGPSPRTGCSDGSMDVVQDFGQSFNIGGTDGCTELSFTATADSFLVNWHMCAGVPLCPYSAAIRDYAGLLFSIAVPEGVPPLFTLRTKTTVAMPSGCCFRDFLATGEVVWSPQSQPRSAASPPPPPQFIGQWYLIAGVACTSIVLPFLIWRTSSRRRILSAETQYQFVPRPAGVEFLAIVDLALGSLLLLAAGRLIPVTLSFFWLNISSYPFLGLLLAMGVLFETLGLWLGHDWARGLTLIGSALSIVKSLFDMLSVNPLQWVVSLLSVFLAAYIVSYLGRPEVKMYFAGPATPVSPTIRIARVEFRPIA